MQQSGLEVFLIVGYKSLPIHNKLRLRGVSERIPLDTFRSKAASFQWVCLSPDPSPLVDARLYTAGEAPTQTMGYVTVSDSITLSSHPDPKSGQKLSVMLATNCMIFSLEEDGSLSNPVVLKEQKWHKVISHCVWGEYLVCFPTSGNPKISKNGALLLSLDQILPKNKDQVGFDSSSESQFVFHPKEQYFNYELGAIGRIAKIRDGILYFLTSLDDLVMFDLSQLDNIKVGPVSPDVCPNLKYSSLRQLHHGMDYFELCDFDINFGRLLLVLTETGNLLRYFIKKKSKQICSLKLLSEVQPRNPLQPEKQELYCAVACCSKYVVVGRSQTKLSASGSKLTGFDLYSAPKMTYRRTHFLHCTRTDEDCSVTGEPHNMVLKEFPQLTVLFSMPAFGNLTVLAVHKDLIIPIKLHIQFPEFSYSISMVVIRNHVFVAGSHRVHRITFNCSI